ncbi:MAG: DNA mismatch repair protein MutS, partial [Candidatus Zophobacter franzmannii]|nr:DNA mismatch repair protein MutS [Candidatus Zophobacter franzmannii]
MTKDSKKLTPMMVQYWKFKDEHPDKLLLFRMGDFYETFYEDAKVTAKILGITLTSRSKKDEDRIPLAGFPYHALDNYLDKLVRSGLKVAICEQVEDPKLAVGVVKRDIVRIITPGAILDQQLLETNANNFLCALVVAKNKIGLSVLDISTGDFLFTEVNADQVVNEIQRLLPSELLVLNEETKLFVESLKLEKCPPITIVDGWQYDPKTLKKEVKKHFHTSTFESLGAQNRLTGITAAGVNLAYAKDMQRDDLNHITEIHFYSLSNYMQLDEVTRRNLELVRSMRYGDRYGSLISVLDETQTPMGTRMLQKWLLHPLLSKDEIEQRLDAVQNMIQRITYSVELRKMLSEIGDLSRLLSKLGALRINPREINALAIYLETASELKKTLENYTSPLLLMLKDSILAYEPIIESIKQTITTNPPVQITDGSIINDGVHSELDELRSISKDGKSWIARLEDDEKKKTGITSLKVGYNKVFGYYLEVTKMHKDKVPDYYIRKQTLVSSERYISPKLKEFEAKVLSAEDKIKSLEYELYSDLRLKLQEQIEVMQKFVQIVGTLDVLSNFAFIAYTNRYTRPTFNDEGLLTLDSCRHPVIEKLLESEQFIPNDVELDSDKNLIAILTGPNMAGKSTYLRQIGLVAIMAQIGCFVPADKADIPIF